MEMLLQEQNRRHDDLLFERKRENNERQRTRKVLKDLVKKLQHIRYFVFSK